MILPPLPLGFSSPPSLDYFVIGLVFQPRSQDLKFNPSSISIVLDGKEILPAGSTASYPVSHGGPPGNNATPSMVNSWSCFYRQYRDHKPWARDALEQFSGNTVLSLKKDTCVWVVWDVPPPLPSKSFILRIEGLSESGSALPVPDIKFRK